MDSIIWKGVPSTSIKGLLICELPPIVKPSMRIKQTQIDGRDGSIIEDLGYESYEKSVAVGLYGDFNIDEVIKYFTGEGEIVFSNEPDKVYRGKIFKEVEYDRLLRYRKAKVSFKIQPFKYAHNEEPRATQTEEASGTSIVVNNSVDDKLKSLKIYGKTIQDGTPTPNAPVEISVVAGSVVVKATSLEPHNESIITYNLGAEFMAEQDYIENGVLIKNIKKIVLTGEESMKLETNSVYTRFYISNVPDIKVLNGRKPIVSTHFVYAPSGNSVGIGFVEKGKIYLYPPTDVTTVDAFRDWLSLNRPEIYYPVENVEGVLLGEKPQTFMPNTTISNDNGLNMEVTYIKPFDVICKGFETSRPKMTIKGTGTIEIAVNGVGVFSYTFPEGENEVIIDSEIEDAYLGAVLKNRNMNGEFPILQPGTNKIEWSGDVESIEVEPRSRWL